MFINDPTGDWEAAWTDVNPEPHKEWREQWTMEQVAERVDWHTRRWMAYTQLCVEHGWRTGELAP